MNKTKKKYLIMILLTTFVFLLFQSIGYAEDDDPLGFTIESILSDSQIDKEQNYFYVKTEPGKPQEVKVKVTGTSEEPVKVKAFVVNASTSEQGTINYNVGIEKADSLIDSMEEITIINTPEFEIKEGEERIVTVQINTPKDSYEGIKLGAIYFERVNEEPGKAGSVDSSYSYRIGLMISESDTTYTDGKVLEIKKVTPELKRLQKTIQVTLQNPEPKTIEDFTMEVSIVNEENGKVLKRQELKNGRIAPNSQFDFGVEWGIEPIPAGNYIAKVEASSRYENWTLEKKFSITAEQAKKMNEETLYKLTLPIWSYLVTGGILIAMVGDAVY